MSSWTTKLGYVCVLVGMMLMTVGYVRATQANATPPPRLVSRPPMFGNRPPVPVPLADTLMPVSASAMMDAIQNDTNVLQRQFYDAGGGSLRVP